MCITSPVEPTRTLADLVADSPARAVVLERLGLDYCCHGQRTLAAACGEAGLDPSAVAAELGAAPAAARDDIAGLDVAELADHIVATHHEYLHRELPELVALAEKVWAVHGERHPELRQVHELVLAIRADLEPHLLKEEQVLFPALRALVGGARRFHFGTVQNPIRMMGLEHERAGELLALLREATGGYTVPADGCASYTSLYQRLEALELDTHLHIHKENNILFPAAVSLEATSPALP